MPKYFLKIIAVCGLLVAYVEVGFCQNNWTGQVQCQLNIQNSDYVHQEIQNWIITGPPTQQGAMQIYPATWSTSGQGTMQRMQGTQMSAGQWTTNVQGMNAPFAVSVRPSDRRVVISQFHAQVVAQTGASGIKQSGATRSNFTFSASEWRFPMIDAGPNDNVVSGSGTAQVAGGSLPLLAPSVTATATCRWQFNRSGAGTPAAPSPTLNSSVSPPLPGGAISAPTNQPPTNQGTTSPAPNPPSNAPAGGPAVTSGPASNSSSAAAATASPQTSTGGTVSTESQSMVHSHTPVGKISTFVDKDTEDYEKATGFVAQIMFQMDQLMDDQAIQQLSAAEWKDIEQQTGGKLVKEEHVFRLPPFPASGYWLSLGNQRYMVSYKGIVNTPTRPASTKNLPLYVQVGDESPYAVLPSVDFVDSGAKPTPTIFKLIQKLPPSMNRHTDTAMLDEHRLEPGGWPAKLQTLEYKEGEHSHCVTDVAQQRFSDNPALQLIPDRCRNRAPCAAGNDEPCCLDYDGPSGDGKPIARNAGDDCLAIGAKFFEWSTCFVWTVAGACANEAALPWNNLNAASPAPNCYSNHKYRNCQNLNANDFKLNPSSTLIKFGESSDLLLRNYTVGNSTCLDIDTKGPTAKLDLNSLGTLQQGHGCGGYRADHFSDQAQKHYEQMKFRFITPKITAPKPCQATYKVVATSGGKASNATIVATNPRCGGWSGTIEFEREVEWDFSADPGGPFEIQEHMSEDSDTTLTISNNTGISNSYGKKTYSYIAYQGALRGQIKTRIVQLTTNTQASANGGSAARVEVKLDAKTGEYQVDPYYLPAVGNEHTVSTSRDEVFPASNSTYYANPLVDSDFKGITGKTKDFKHIQGTWIGDLKMPPDHPGRTGGGKVAVSWNLTFKPGPQ